MRFFSFMLFLLVCIAAKAQITIVVNSIPESTPAGAEIFITGSFNNWNPADVNYRMLREGDQYVITLPVSTGEAEYKFTRGSWANAEANADGSQMENRKFTYVDLTRIDVSIGGWEDQRLNDDLRESTALPNVKIISDRFYMPQLNRTRRVWIYLPVNYEKDNARYPVIYMQDGQNLFDNLTSFSGEWGIDETMAAKEQASEKTAIVVGVDNGGDSRMNEYAPYVNATYGGGEGKAYTEFLVKTLKPYIDSAYRTLPDRNNTAVAGSSMGGLISLYAAVTYPQVFSKAAILSPSFWFNDSLYRYILTRKNTLPVKYYITASAEESTTMVSGIDSITGALTATGDPKISVETRILADGAHSEWFWRREFPNAYDWLFDNQAKAVIPMPSSTQVSVVLTPNPAADFIRFNVRVEAVEIMDRFQKSRLSYRQVRQVDITSLPDGDYTAVVQYGSTTQTIQFLVRRASLTR